VIGRGRRALGAVALGSVALLSAIALSAIIPTAGVGQVPDSLAGERYASLTGTRARIAFAPEDSLVALRVLALLDGQAGLPGLPDTVPNGVTAVLAHSPEAFDELTGGVVPEWRAGVAIPSANMLVIPTGEGPRVLDGEGRRTLRHEWAHLGLHGYLDDLRAPRWFDEGYAQWASGGFDTSEAWRLRVLIAAGRAPSMDSLSLGWPTRTESSMLCFARRRAMRCSGVPGSPNMRSKVTCGFTDTGSGLWSSYQDIVLKNKQG
jgi:hypothetical protein